MQARALVVVGRVDAGAALEQQPDLLKVAVARELAQHRGGVGLVKLEQPALVRVRVRARVRVRVRVRVRARARVRVKARAALLS